MANTATYKPAENGQVIIATLPKIAAQPTTEDSKQPPTLAPDRPSVFSDAEAGKVENTPIAPISERLEKLEMLNQLIQQRDDVTEALDSLQKFEQSPNGGQQVIFRSANGTSSSTQNPVAISAMVAQGITMLKTKLFEIESQIIF